MATAHCWFLSLRMHVRSSDVQGNQGNSWHQTETWHEKRAIDQTRQHSLKAGQKKMSAKDSKRLRVGCARTINIEGFDKMLQEVAVFRSLHNLD
jgi:hypothetical protein